MFKITLSLLLVFTISAFFGCINNKAVASLLTGSNDGGFLPTDVNDERIKEMATFATETLASENADFGRLELVEISSAGKQVVGGINYRLELELKKENGERLCCKVTVFDQPWTNTRKLADSECKPVKSNSTK